MAVDKNESFPGDKTLPAFESEETWRVRIPTASPMTTAKIWAVFLAARYKGVTFVYWLEGEDFLDGNLQGAKPLWLDFGHHEVCRYGSLRIESSSVHGVLTGLQISLIDFWPVFEDIQQPIISDRCSTAQEPTSFLIAVTKGVRLAPVLLPSFDSSGTLFLAAFEV